MSMDTAVPAPARAGTTERSTTHTTRPPVRLTTAQDAALRADLNPDLIRFDPSGHAHVEGAYVRAKLTEIFGFGMWSDQTVRLEEVQRREIPKPGGQSNWYVSYLCTVRLTAYDPYGAVLGPYDGTSVETGAMSRLGDSIELAVKAAETVALKRAAINLGSQFGLSLYRKGPGGDALRPPATRAVPRTLYNGEFHSSVEPSVEEIHAGRTPAPAADPGPARTAADIVPKQPPTTAAADPLGEARRELRAFAQSVGMPDAVFDGALAKKFGVGLDETTAEQLAAIRTAIERIGRRG